MSTIQFDEPNIQFRSRRILGEPEIPSVVKFLLKRGIARDEQHATKILVISICVLFLISIILFVNALSPSDANIYYSGSDTNI